MRHSRAEVHQTLVRMHYCVDASQQFVKPSPTGSLPYIIQAQEGSIDAPRSFRAAAYTKVRFDAWERP
jgi:hypothetical protein